MAPVLATAEPLDRLLQDAELVVAYGTRVGRLAPDLVPALAAVRAGGDAPGADEVARLHTSLSAAIAAIAPVTLLDLRGGWNPFVERPARRLGRIAFGLSGILLFLATVWCTALYNKANGVLAALHAIQEARPTEQVARVFRGARQNQDALAEALSGGGRDLVYDSFTRSVADLQQLNERIEAFVPLAYDVKGALDSPFRALFRLIALPEASTDRSGLRSGADDMPDWQRQIADWEKNYGSESPAPAAVGAAPGQPDEGANRRVAPFQPDVAPPTIEEQIDAEYRNISRFNEILRIQIHPQAYPAFTKLISDIEDGRTLLGAWIIPGLYGMLGAVVFHMRRILEPLLPNPPLARLIYRICLGGLAGVVIAWFWTPAGGGEAAAVSFSAFSVAFLMGYSIDIFFQLLDRLVESAASAVGRGRPGQAG